MEVWVAFIWHMHQPWYFWPDGERAELPWVRLRAGKDYYDMAACLEETGSPATVNFSPSLTEQLRLLSSGGIRDPYVPDGDPEAFSEIEAGLIPMPLARRGLPPRAEFRDPWDRWAWFHLAWTAQAALERDHTYRGIKGALGQREATSLVQAQLELARAVLPAYIRLGHQGQIELTATPFYHPILPLLLDSQVARRPHPEDEVPPFEVREDAVAQVARALDHHAGIFGGRPKGMWPAEGAVSPEALGICASHGVQWVATDGEILSRTLGRPPSPPELYRPWRLALPEGEIIVVFRDTLLSNLLSFEYGKWPTDKAIQDLLARIRAIGENWRLRTPPLVVIAMDGENAWDFYEGNGRPFLLGLYRSLRGPGFVPTTVSAYLERFGSGGELHSIWSGSWIDADFRTWIGEPLQNRAWMALAEASKAARSSPDPERQRKAREALHVVEGSDWFWWRSSRHPNPLAPHFSRLFRAHLAQAWQFLGKTPPPELDTL